jgi:hypothetical protein
LKPQFFKKIRQGNSRVPLGLWLAKDPDVVRPQECGIQGAKQVCATLADKPKTEDDSKFKFVNKQQIKLAAHRASSAAFSSQANEHHEGAGGDADMPALPTVVTLAKARSAARMRTSPTDDMVADLFRGFTVFSGTSICKLKLQAAIL